MSHYPHYQKFKRAVQRAKSDKFKQRVARITRIIEEHGFYHLANALCYGEMHSLKTIAVTPLGKQRAKDPNVYTYRILLALEGDYQFKPYLT